MRRRDRARLAARPIRLVPAPLPPDRDPDDVSVRTDELEWIEGLQALFERQGIGSRIYPVEDLARRGTRNSTRYEIAVAPRDAKRAFALDREFLQGRLGDDEIELTEIPPAGICPYCGAEAPAESTECPTLRTGDRVRQPGDRPGVFIKLSPSRTASRSSLFSIPRSNGFRTKAFPAAAGSSAREAVMDNVFGRLGREWEGWGADVDRWLDAGESVVALGAYHGTNRATGRSMTAAFAHVLWLQGGRVVRFEQYADTAKVVAACPGPGAMKT